VFTDGDRLPDDIAGGVDEAGGLVEAARSGLEEGSVPKVGGCGDFQLVVLRK
jgi:hypothetical protein